MYKLFSSIFFVGISASCLMHLAVWGDEPYGSEGFDVTYDDGANPPTINATGTVSGTVLTPSYIQAFDDILFEQITLGANSTLATFVDSTDADKVSGMFVAAISQGYGITFDNHGDLSYSISTAPAGSSPSNLLLPGIGAVVVGQKISDVPSVTDTKFKVVLNHYGSVTLISSLDSYNLETDAYQPVVSALVADSSTYVDNTAPSEALVMTYSGSKINVSGDGSMAMGGISVANSFNAAADYQAQSNQPVKVVHGGELVLDAEYGAGISASATGIPFSKDTALDSIANPVYVTVQNTGTIAVNTSENSKTNVGIGILAVSNGFLPDNAKSGTTVTGGLVSVALDSAQDPSDSSSIIKVGNANTKLGIGVLAVSSGTGGGLDPYSEGLASSSNGQGSGGEVTVTSSRAIETQGEMSIGIAALSLGGQNTVTTVGSGNTGTVSVGNYDSDHAPGGGDAVEVTLNEGGDISTLGTTAHGVVALSASGGGVVINELAQDYSSSTGTQLGDASGSSSSKKGEGKDGGTVEVVNNATISTGDSNGTGVASVGIVAQSIGGGGGSAGGKACVAVYRWFG
tara:strand:- start:16758 stop:18473 length:1716 start_codon:yes stop_codon:yes gene_type:complete